MPVRRAFRFLPTFLLVLLCSSQFLAVHGQQSRSDTKGDIIPQTGQRFHRQLAFAPAYLSTAAQLQAPEEMGRALAADAAFANAPDSAQPGPGRDYIYPEELGPRIAQAAQPEPADGATVSYTAFDKTQYSMIQYNGAYVAFLIQPASLKLGRYSLAQLRAFIDHLDVLYSHFREIMGSEPPGATQLLHIAFVKTCSAGCGIFGNKGIELDPGMLDPANGPPDGFPYFIAIHEMTHNFDFYSSYIMYGPDAAHSWVNFMTFYIDVYNQEGFGGGGGQECFSVCSPGETLQVQVDMLFTSYLNFPNSNWTTCVLNNACSPPSDTYSMAQHAQGGLVLRVAQLHGAEGVKAFIQYLKNAISTRKLNAGQMDVLTKNDLLLESLANGVGANLSCYVDAWKWPISDGLRSQLQAAFGDNPNCVDHDGDGYSVLTGDCNDQNRAVHPGATEVLNGIDDDCNGIVDDLLLQETTEFGQSAANAKPSPFPARILGSIRNPQDSDFFRLTIPAQGNVRFELKSLDTFKGWLFLYKQDNSGWLQYEHADASGSPSLVDANLTSGSWIFNVAYNNDSNPGNYQARVYSSVPWPSTLTAPPAASPAPGTATLVTPPLPKELQGVPNLTARFWVEGSGWVGTQPLDSRGAASLSFTTPSGVNRCALSYRVEFLSADLPVSPTSNPAFFSAYGAPLPCPPPSVPSNGIVNAAGFTSAVAGLSPGAIASIFGTNLSNTLAAGVLPGLVPGTSTLNITSNGTTVTFDGVAAPLFFVSPGQLNVQVPFELAGKSSSQLVVTVNGSSSTPVTMAILPSTPALFTVNSSGKGPAAALNEDGTTNSASNPAPAGTVIQLFATGLGAVSPPGVTGQLAPTTSPLSVSPTLPSVTIGGTAANVQFSGLAPGFAGLWQVNLTVPSGLASGAVPLLLSVGGQNANPVTVFVK